MAFKNNFTITVSGKAISMQWKPKQSDAPNLIAFADGQATYTSSYVSLEILGNDGRYYPHLALPDHVQLDYGTDLPVRFK